MNFLKLVALDKDDLDVISAHVQDAVVIVGDLDYQPAARRFIMPNYRFVWEERGTFLRPSTPQRRNSVLHFDRVSAVKSVGIRRDKADDVLSLLAIRFMPEQEPGGRIELTFSGGAMLALEVECIEVRLADLGGAWQAASRPVHQV